MKRQLKIINFDAVHNTYTGVCWSRVLIAAFTLPVPSKQCLLYNIAGPQKRINYKLLISNFQVDNFAAYTSANSFLFPPFSTKKLLIGKGNSVKRGRLKSIYINFAPFCSDLAIVNTDRHYSGRNSVRQLYAIEITKVVD